MIFSVVCITLGSPTAILFDKLKIGSVDGVNYETIKLRIITA